MSALHEEATRRRRPGGPAEPGLRIGVLSAADIDDVHAATLAVLERTGVLVEADEALAIFADGGCETDRERHLVRMPPEVVEAAIASCAGDPRGDCVGETERRTTYANFDEGVFYVDPWTGRRREPGKQDVAHCARLVDALPNIDDYGAAVRPRDVPTATAGV